MSDTIDSISNLSDEQLREVVRSPVEARDTIASTKELSAFGVDPARAAREELRRREERAQAQQEQQSEQRKRMLLGAGLAGGLLLLLAAGGGNDRQEQPALPDGREKR